MNNTSTSSVRATNKLIPELRFPDFLNDGNWNEGIIENIANAESSSVALNKLELKKEGYPVYGADSIVGFIENYQHEENYISIVKDGSGVGRLNLAEGKSTILGTLTALKSKDVKKYNLNWIYYLLNTIDFTSYIKGAGIPHIYYSDYKNEKILIPPKPTEQQKIADCLSSLDEVITAHANKLETLKTYKKGLMQNLFPQEGEKVPKLRFKEFEKDGEWEEKQLNELGDLINGLTYSPNDVREKGLLVLRSSNIQNGVIELKDCVYVRDDINGANPIKSNDILVCVRNGSKNLIGKNAIIPKEIPRATHGAFMTVFRAKKPEFVFQLFQTDFYDKQVQADLGATINSINGKNFMKYTFSVPENPNEQRKIADTLSSLDDLIKEQSDKIEKLKLHKKGLMQGLFPKVNS
ncbi:restriction endonuclease subunit S [Chryseobacterium taihuense]|uniref:Restriction endonuclease S subunit n=1 Tax=Chryseobacterium taihuense TaxID=1141221 RepID=A0ABY0QR19_9FLAO|nr:restriction endonuclease subunit S [Chryseobacterium taihuense]SDL59210.1 Restriction endonuclease S subunit [Chryseobacterium taihuense]